MTQTFTKTVITTLLLVFSHPVSATQTVIHLTTQQAQHIGQKIWHNEGAGKIENLTAWNRGESFPSFGIGHFIWYPAGVEAPFTESFPALLAQLKQNNTPLPDWLNNSTDAPWQSREAFYAEIDRIKMKQLRRLLQDTIPQQVQFIVQRMEAALPRMLATLPTQTLRDQISRQFYRVAGEPNGIYALIDYVNFKGEGISDRERYQGQGWGLLQVLESMSDEPPVITAFVDAADAVLTQRVQNAPRDESHWLPGWHKRLQTYLNP